MRSHDYSEILEQELKDPEFRTAYESLEDEFAVAKEIIRLRKAKGWTQQELAQHANTSQPAIARLESGNYRNVSLSFLRRLGVALGAVPVIHMQPVDSRAHQHA